MDGEIRPLGILILFAWLGAGAYGVFTFVRTPKPRMRELMGLIIGVVMLALGLVAFFQLVQVVGG